ncbi:MAG: hypothetical protein ACU83N_13020 [Gammaproteobacteria bacterium]
MQFHFNQSHVNEAANAGRNPSAFLHIFVTVQPIAQSRIALEPFMEWKNTD